MKVHKSTQAIVESSDWRLLPWVLLAAFILRFGFGLYTQSILQPDEIYQYLEQAHRLVFGWGFIPWEFQHGARSWLIPAAIAPILKVCALIGDGQPDVYEPAVKFALCAVATTLPFSVYRIGQATLCETAARFALVGVSIWYELINIAARPLPDALGTYALFGAFAILVSPPKKGTGFVLGALIGLVLAIRFVFLPAAAVMLVIGAIRKREYIADALVALAVIITLAGALDAITLGRWFGSVLGNIEYNVGEGLANTFGVAPPYGYVIVLLVASAGLAGVGIVLAISNRTMWTISLPLLVQFVALSAVGHKEPRYIIFMVPLWLLGLSAFFIHRFHGGVALTALGIALISFAGFARALPFETLVLYPRPVLARSDIREAYLALSRRKDVRGLIDASGVPWAFMGGYYDFNQRAPIYRSDIPATQFDRVVHAPSFYANYWLGYAQARPPEHFAEPVRFGNLTLWRRQDKGPIVVPAGYSEQLPDWAVLRRPGNAAPSF